MAATTVPLPLTRGRVAALAVGVPVCLLLVAGTGLNLVATLGEGRYPVSYAVPMTAKSLNVSLDGGQLTLQPTAASQATLTGTARYSLVRSKLTEQTRGNRTTVGYRCSVPFGDCELDATVNVPAGLPVVAATDGGDASVSGIASEVMLSSGGGTIGADDILGPLLLNTSGGNINVSAITSATMTASTGGGNIHAAGVHSRTVSVTTSGGNIEAAGISAAAVTATSGGGNIEIDFATVPSGVQVDTSGGNITLVLPPGDAAYLVDARTDGGEVSDTLRQDPASRNVITAKSGGGNITIRQQ
jgi:hypothetical protein